MKALLTAFSLLIAVSFTSYGQDSTNVPSTSNYFLTFVKKVYLNPTILLKTQNFRSQHNVRVMLLPDMNGQTDNTITAFERAMQKIIRFLTVRNIGVLITDHNVRETLGICDRAYIVNEGCVFAAGEPSEIIHNDSVREVYLGKDFRL